MPNNDIERNPGPEHEMVVLLLRLFKQQEVKFQTLFGEQFRSLEKTLFVNMDICV